MICISLLTDELLVSWSRTHHVFVNFFFYIYFMLFRESFVGGTNPMYKHKMLNQSYLREEKEKELINYSICLKW